MKILHLILFSVSYSYAIGSMGPSLINDGYYREVHVITWYVYNN